jgi:hypothetical protein
MTTSIPITVAFIAGACTPTAPADPSFQVDVLPILAANCVRCHGFPAMTGPREFRLDTFGDVAVTDGQPGSGCGGDPLDPDPITETVICGTAASAPLIPARIADDHPSRFPLDDYQIETLENWARTAQRGAARPGNAAPTLVIEDTTQSGTLVTVRARVDDADHDVVAGTLRTTAGGRDRLVGPVRSGTLDLVWETVGIPPGDYPLVANLDDGAEIHVLAIGVITVGAP